MNQIVQGDCLTVLKTMANDSIDCVVTSPPYWALRDYGVDGQIGLEETYQEYIAKLVAIFDEVKRVLRNTGTCWVNLGDSYMSKATGDVGENAQLGGSRRTQREAAKRPDKKGDIPEKCLAQIPSRFALAMTKLMKGETVEVEDEYGNKYDPAFKVSFKKK